MSRLTKLRFVLIFLITIALCGCEGVIPRDTRCLPIPRFHRSEIFDFVARLGTTFAAVPDLLATPSSSLRRGNKPKDGRDHGRLPDVVGLLRIVDFVEARNCRNVITILVNSLNVATYFHFVNEEKAHHAIK